MASPRNCSGLCKHLARGVPGLKHPLTSPRPPVHVPIPPNAAHEVLAIANGNPVYVFWSGVGDEESATKNWAKYLAKLFDDAKITSGHCGHTGGAIRSPWIC